MSDLAAIFGTLTRYHRATHAEPLPPIAPGVTWVWAGNGIFKRGVDRVSDILICVAPVATPGLPALVPHVHWRAVASRLPGQLLHAVLLHARRAGSAGRVARPIEQQYHITSVVGMLQVRVPPQQATATQVRYTLGTAPVLCDLHSHHGMPAYFSSTDDADDQGLGISVVLGKIYDQPQIVVRANVYGHRMRLNACSVFDRLPADLSDRYCEEDVHAAA